MTKVNVNQNVSQTQQQQQQGTPVVVPVVVPVPGPVQEQSIVQGTPVLPRLPSFISEAQE